MADLRKTTKNYTASDQVCECCESNYNSWQIELVERSPTGERTSSTYFYCFVCDRDA